MDQNGSTTQRIALGDFPPLMGAVDLAVDRGAQRLYVSTEAGYVSWAPLAGLLSGTLSFTSTGTPGRGVGVANAPPAHCNRTLSATWGMVVDNGKLQVIDQAGSRWSVDGTGNVTLEAEVGHEVQNNLIASRAPARGPFRAMRKLGGLTAMAASEVRSRATRRCYSFPGCRT